MSEGQLTVNQYGVETTSGTLVAATRRVAGGNIDWEAPDEVDHRPDRVSGVYTKNASSPVVESRGTKLTYDGELSLEEIVDFLEMIRGLAAPTGVGPWTWTFTLAEAASNAPKTYTFERRLTDGTNPADQEAGFVFAKSIQISCAVNEATKLKVEMEGRRVQASTLTPALAIPALTFLTHGMWAVWIDPDTNAFGTTAITGKMRSFELNYDSGLRSVFFLDGRADLDFSQQRQGPRGADLKMVMEWDTNATPANAQSAIERAAAAAQSRRLVRLKATTGALSAQFDMVLRHEKGDFLTVRNEDGIEYVELSLVPAYDDAPSGSDPNNFKAVIINNRATL